MMPAASHHLRIGAQLDLFHLEDAAPGATYWHAAGTAIRLALLENVRLLWRYTGYVEVATPLLSLLGRRHNEAEVARTSDECLLAQMGDAQLVLTRRPCQFHRQLFEHRTRSLHLLPLRYAELASCHGRTALADLCGLLRQREYCADIGHIYCTPEQIDAEVEAFHEQCLTQLRALDLLELKVQRGWCVPSYSIPGGGDPRWRFAQALRGLAADEDVGVRSERASAQRLSYLASDRNGTPWRLGGIKIDGVSAPCGLAVLHRSTIGSIERCVALLIERYGAALPAWLAPSQVAVSSDDALADARVRDAAARLSAAGLRTRIADAATMPWNAPGDDDGGKQAPFTVVIAANHVADRAEVAIIRRGSAQVQRLPLPLACRVLSEMCAGPDASRRAGDGALE